MSQLKKHPIEFLLIIVILIIIITPYLFTRKYICEAFDFSNTGQIGDTIGGITAPFVGILSILLLYITFRQQRKFNKKQEEKYVDEHFQSIYFNLLKEQREIMKNISAQFTNLHLSDSSSVPVNEEISNVLGVSFFKKAQEELSLILYALNCSDYYYGDDYSYDYFYDQTNEEGVTNLNNIQECYGAEVENIVENFDTPEEREAEIKKTEEKYKREVVRMRIAYTNKKYAITKEQLDKYKSCTGVKEKIKIAVTQFLNKYDCTSSYYRHLRSILNFVEILENDKINILGERDSVHKQYKEYARILQSQMSKEEIVMLFYASFAYNNNLQQLLGNYNFFEDLSPRALLQKEHNCIPELKLKV
jgi:hypothetical protein